MSNLRPIDRQAGQAGRAGKRARKAARAPDSPLSPLERAHQHLRKSAAIRPKNHILNNASAEGTYDGANLRTFVRPGALDAFALPSRVGNRLHYPGGRVEAYPS